ncbi:type 1 glutamine amidotransferase [Candidatus Uhrbacteria bacterium]|nr:MAG: type 1 glutamine amidotransferase [Candidatus Uhrbacteria bacterium]
MYMNVLLVQFRDDAMREHETTCLIEQGGIEPDELTTLDALAGIPDPSIVRGYDAVILGGSGGYCVSEKHSWLEPTYELLREARIAGIPTLGICFGAHAMSEAFGGRVEQRKEDQETGSFEVMLNENAKGDAVFDALPDRFWAQLGHKDFIVDVPPGAVNLASTERAAHQAWTFPGEPIYAIQFHPELTKEGLTDRVLYYLDQYVGDDKAALQAIIDHAKSSEEATRTLANFLALAKRRKTV